MSEQKYIAIYNPVCDQHSVAVRTFNGAYRMLDMAEIIAALCHTPPQPAGIVWRKPGEAGRVSGKKYAALWSDGDMTTRTWNSTFSSGGWGIPGVIAWADLPSPPAWATGGAA